MSHFLILASLVVKNVLIRLALMCSDDKFTVCKCMVISVWKDTCVQIPFKEGSDGSLPRSYVSCCL